MNTIPLLLFAALLTELPARSDLPQQPGPARSPAAAKGDPAASPAFPVTSDALLPQLPQPRVAAGARPLAHVLFDRPQADGPLWAVGRAWKASFDGTGCTVVPFFGSEAPRNFPLRLELAQATVGGEPLALVAGEPVVSGESIRTERGALTEVVATSLENLEQSFVFHALPNRGPIAVDVRMHGEFTTEALGNGLRFGNEFGHIDYTKAVAVDATGQRLPLDIVWTGECAHMEIPAAFVAKARLPIVLDPVLNSWYLLASGQTQLQHDSDVASIQATSIGGRTLFVWQRQWSTTDQDCFGLMFDGTLGLVQTDFLIDTSTDDWTRIAVAGNNYAQNFLVVAEVRLPVFLGSTWHIAGRTVAANAAVGGVFNIERDGVVGSGGNNFHPDVGSDPYYGVGRYTVVFNKRNGSASDIYMKQVTTAGGLATINPIALDTSAAEESNPTISKSCGQSNGLSASWIVTWQRTYSASDQDAFGQLVNWNGALTGAVFTVAGSSANDTAPSAGSPMDVNGVRYWPVCWESATSPGQPRDVYCRMFRVDGLLMATGVVSQGVPGADDRDPEVDSDGSVRFVVGLTTGTTGYPQGVQAVTMTYLPTTNSFRVDGRNGMNTSGAENYGECNVCADFSGGGNVSPRYFVSFTAQATNTFDLVNFGGYTGSPNFYTYRSTQCGNLAITPSGSTVIGQTMQVSVANGALSGTFAGFPGGASLQLALGCNCFTGVDSGNFFGNPFVWTIPQDPLLVGSSFSIQGYTAAGSSCLGFIDFSDTVDFTIH